MLIKKLFLNNFRNYVSGHFEYSDGVNIVSGGNAQGKTNSAEAIFYLCTGYSPRATRDKQVIRYGEAKAVVRGVAASAFGDVDVEMTFYPDKNKEVRINGVPVAKIGELLGNILWQPGETYKLQPIYIKNNGDLDFVYKIVVNGLEGQAALNTYMSWKVKVNGVETEIANFEQTLGAGAANVKVELIGTLSAETPVTMMGESAEGITITVYAKQTTDGATYAEA